jgi:CRP-like cAMP-binding protein
MGMQTNRECMEALARLELFSGVSDRDLRWLARRGTMRRHLPGAVLLAEGGLPGAVLIIVKGRVQVTRDDLVLGEAGAGEVVGHFAALTGAVARTATVRAASHVTTVALSSASFLELLEAQPKVALRITAAVCRQVAPTVDA